MGMLRNFCQGLYGFFATLSQPAYFYLWQRRFDDSNGWTYLFIEKNSPRKVKAIIAARQSGFWFNKLRIEAPAELANQQVSLKDWEFVTSNVGKPRLESEAVLGDLLFHWKANLRFGWFGSLMPTAKRSAYISFKGIYFDDDLDRAFSGE